MGRVKAPRPRGYDPGGFRFPAAGWRLDKPRGVLFANDLAAPREPRPVAADRVTWRPAVAERRRHGVFKKVFGSHFTRFSCAA